MSQRPLWQRTFFTLASAFVAALVVLIPINPRWQPYPGRDSGVFLYSGWRILAGEVPYRDLWDHKPPVIFYIDALGLWLGNGSRWGVWVLELLALVAAVLFSYRFLSQVVSKQAALVAVLCWLAALPFMLEGGNLTTEYTLPLQFAALMLFTDVVGRVKSSRQWFLIGLLGGVAFLTKQSAAGLWLSMGIYLVLTRNWQHRSRQFAIESTAFLLGIALPIILTALYFGRHDALSELWNAAFRYNALYVNNPWQSRIGNLIRSRHLFSSGFLLPLAGLGFMTMWRPQIQRDSRANAVVHLALILIPIEISLILLSGRGYSHYFITTLPVLSLCAAVGWQTVADLIARFVRPELYRRTVTASLMTIIVVGTLWGMPSMRLDWPRSEPQRVISYVRQHSSEADSVLLVGAETWVNFSARRVSPSRFTYQYPLWFPYYAHEADILQFLNDVVAEEPKLIFDTQGQPEHFLRFSIQTDATEARRTELLADYEKAGSINGWDVYHRTDANP
ncbi:MAG: glycosyltransferase family 39 protein [Anaerolineales bacterium]|nr:glycosyltransferase family 39 protein [Anaerolineales bacterium]MCB9128184.1 glycosyltransferase family 39 protein [Ardenticatenales bacterium]MCB9171893.1 glycosyltransferase family 39 protein [Ardenticatenales bacterium]